MNNCFRYRQAFMVCQSEQMTNKQLAAYMAEKYPEIASSGYCFADHFDNGTDKGGSRGSGSTCKHRDGCLIQVSKGVYAPNPKVQIAGLPNPAPAPAPDALATIEREYAADRANIALLGEQLRVQSIVDGILPEHASLRDKLLSHLSNNPADYGKVETFLAAHPELFEQDEQDEQDEQEA